MPGDSSSSEAPIARVDTVLVQLEGVLLAVCTGTAPLLPAEQCDKAREGYDAAAIDLKRLADALVQVDAALAVVEAMAQ